MATAATTTLPGSSSISEARRGSSREAKKRRACQLSPHRLPQAGRSRPSTAILWCAFRASGRPEVQRVAALSCRPRTRLSGHRRPTFAPGSGATAHHPSHVGSEPPLAPAMRSPRVAGGCPRTTGGTRVRRVLTRRLRETPPRPGTTGRHDGPVTTGSVARQPRVFWKDRKVRSMQGCQRGARSSRRPPPTRSRSSPSWGPLPSRSTYLR